MGIWLHFQIGKQGRGGNEGVFLLNELIEAAFIVQILESFSSYARTYENTFVNNPRITFGIATKKPDSEVGILV